MFHVSRCVRTGRVGRQQYIGVFLWKHRSIIRMGMVPSYNLPESFQDEARSAVSASKRVSCDWLTLRLCAWNYFMASADLFCQTVRHAVQMMF